MIRLCSFHKGDTFSVASSIFLSGMRAHYGGGGGWGATLKNKIL